MSDESERLEAIVYRIDITLTYAVKLPLAFMHERGDVENFIMQMLGIRAIALGSAFERVDTRGWLAKRYPEIPGPIRCVNEATKRKYPHDDVARSRMFTEDMGAMVLDLKAAMPSLEE